MKQKLAFASTLLVTIFSIIGCERAHVGANTGGGLIPTNYIMIKDSSFSPANLSMVSGNSITFVNQSSIVQRLISDDSTTIRDTSIQPNKSYFWKKDTFGTFNYHLVNKTTARGSLTITP